MKGHEQYAPVLFLVFFLALGGCGSLQNQSSGSSVLLTYPAKGEVDIGTNSSLIVVFSQRMKSESVKLKIAGGTTPVTMTATEIATLPPTYRFTPSASLEASTTYTATLDATSQDSSGFLLSSAYTWTFKTASSIDFEPPSLLEISPALNSKNIKTDAIIEAKFSEIIDLESFTSSSVAVTSEAGTIDGTATFEASSRKIIFAPKAPLAKGKKHTVTFKKGMKDLAGNTFWSDLVTSFTTTDEATSPTPAPTPVKTDFTSPTIEATSPTKGATNVAVTSKVTITFSEAMLPASISTSSIELTLDGVTLAATVTYEATTYVATLTPTSALQVGKIYEVRIWGTEVLSGVTAVKDLAGNMLSGGTITFTFSTATTTDTGDVAGQLIVRNFETGLRVPSSQIPLQVKLNTPSHNGTNVSIKTKVILEFNQKIIRRGPLTLNPSAGYDFAEVGNDRFFTLTFVDKLLSQTKYTLTVAAQSNGPNWTGENGVSLGSDAVYVFTTSRAFTAIAAGGSHGLAVDSSGNLWVWGHNLNGELGIGTTDFASHPNLIQLASMTNIKAVAAGSETSYALKNDGTVWGWGSNEQGQLGNSSKASSSVPMPIAGLSNIAAISAHGSGLLALTSDGRVLHTGLWFPAGNLHLTTTQILSGVKAIAAGGKHFLMLANDGAVWAVGEGTYGALGDGENLDARSDYESSTIAPVKNLSNIKAIAAGTRHSAALDNDGNVWAWGNSSGGQVGNGLYDKYSLPIKVLAGAKAIGAGNNVSYAIMADGTLKAWGISELVGNSSVTNSSRPITVENMSDIVAATAGNSTKIYHGRHALALTDDGKIYTWGSNQNGQLGNGTTTSTHTPVAIPWP